MPRPGAASPAAGTGAGSGRPIADRSGTEGFAPEGYGWLGRDFLNFNSNPTGFFPNRSSEPYPFRWFDIGEFLLGPATTSLTERLFRSAEDYGRRAEDRLERERLAEIWARQAQPGNLKPDPIATDSSNDSLEGDPSWTYQNPLELVTMLVPVDLVKNGPTIWNEIERLASERRLIVTAHPSPVMPHAGQMIAMPARAARNASRAVRPCIRPVAMTLAAAA